MLQARKFLPYFEVEIHHSEVFLYLYCCLWCADLQAGVCATYTTFTGNVQKSLNTGIVTTINFDVVTIKIVVVIVMRRDANQLNGSLNHI